MQKRKLLFSAVLFAMGINSFAQESELVKNYISRYKDLAIAEMQRTGVPASIKLAQGIVETMAGTSELVLKSNNHFGIKCKSNWRGPAVKHDDDAKGECFRKYPSPEDSYRDHSDFLRNNERYAFLFNLDPTDYHSWAKGLKKAGYATNPRYAETLIKTIEDYKLQQYSLMALGKMPAQSGELAPALQNSDSKSIIHLPAKETPMQVQPATIPQNEPQYPKGVFKINDTKVVYVPKGTSYLALAKEFDIDLAKIFEFNELPYAEETDKNRLIYLQRKRKTGVNEYHIVQPGESLHDIAQKHAIRLESLLALNGLKKGEIPAEGEKLNLQKKSSAAPRIALPTNQSLMYPAMPRASN